MLVAKSAQASRFPQAAAVGSYKATITSTSGTAKLLADSQTFFVPGYPVTITTLNLAGQIAPSILVVVHDPSANTSYNATSGVNGMARFNLETWLLRFDRVI